MSEQVKVEKHSEEDVKFLERAVELSCIGINQGKGGPFGAIVVRNGEIVGEGNNQVTSTNDPTAHAEVVAIRDACKKLGSFHLYECTIYTSCEPCPMCLGAIYWSNAKRVVYANTRHHAADIKFNDQFIYEEIPKDHEDRRLDFLNIPMKKALEVFENWEKKEGKTHY